MDKETPVKVLFVCMGNICRSPTAHGVFQALVEENGLGGQVEVDSAGTHSYHNGSPPDGRSQLAAKEKGVDLSKLEARRISSTDFEEFDYIIGMDHSNLKNLLAMKPEQSETEVDLMLAYSSDYDQDEVPDPYFGEDGFGLVFDMIDSASEGLLAAIRKKHGI